MTIGEWIHQTFPLNREGRIVLATFADGGYLSIDPQSLNDLLRSFTRVPTHAELSTMPIASTGGWQKYFDDWKAKGFIA